MSFEKSVKGGTKIKARLAPPKAKYVEHILVATHAGDAGVAEIFRALQNRLRDSTWTIVFKSLIIVHLMIREGEPNVTLKYLADSPSKLAISNFSDVQIQGTNIRHYYNYILARAKAYRDTRIDWVREGQGRLKRQTVDKGLLRETESVQNQISSLLRCELLSTEAENEITVCAFRLLTMDLLVLYGVMNEGTINVLEHYFEMSKYDAQRALAIYKTFTKQTNLVVEFLGTARHYENATRLEIPKLKHAPTSLTASLEEYLNDPDFEVNRRQYLVHQDARKGEKTTSNGDVEASKFKKQPAKETVASNSFPKAKLTQIQTQAQVQAPAGPPPPKSPAPDLIDLFDSIEQNQQPMALGSQQQAANFQNASQFPSQQPQQTGFAPQQDFFGNRAQQPQAQQQGGGVFDSSNPFGMQNTQQPVQTNFTGAGFGGYNQQPFAQQQQPFSSMPQTTGSDFSQQQQPFTPGQLQQQSFMTGQSQQQQPFYTGQQSFAPAQQATITGQQPQTTNPFRQSMLPQATGHITPTYTNAPPIPSPASQQSSNPFARSISNQATGQTSTSPFTPQPPSQNSPFTSPPPTQPTGTPFTSPPPQSQQLSQHLTPQRTGTNPFARTTPQPQQQYTSAAPLVASPTGSTNPFRQSMFVNQQTGQGWQAGQGTMGGLENLDTMPVFPRPGQQPQQQQQPSPWG